MSPRRATTERQKNGATRVETAWAAGLALLLAVRHLHQELITRRRERGLRTGKVSLVLLFLTYVGVMCGAFWRLLISPEDRPAPPAGTVLLLAGTTLFVAAVILRVAALAQLGRFYSYYIEFRPDQPLCTTGPYGVVRHPLHVSLFAEMLGLALIAAWWLAYLLVAIHLATLLVRTVAEEKKLVEHFGERYRSYRKEVPAANALAGLWRRRRRPKDPE